MGAALSGRNQIKQSGRAALLGGLALLAGALGAQAGDGVAVSMNQARIVKMSRAVDTVVVGNEKIVEVTVQDPYTIVLTGKGFGVTNMVALDGSGAPVVDEQVTVSRNTARSLRVYRRAQVQTLSCTPYCESATKNDAETASDADMGLSQ